ncbi:uncharacterized protein ndufv3 [Chiloscyllium plagiosum]|uniref:uncharacterized protein ndufv3 n=1 Tax=Chiloscyllium plagiosum TaxID=36176 RepID=UPI001CB875E6|nr:uncharacterized protein ndufv3 [Chiloscyllium plagiosum]
MAAALGVRVRGLRQVLIVRSGFQAVPLTTKATAPQKKKKVKGAEAAEVSSRDSHIQSAEITSTERASLLAKKTVLLFPKKTPDSLLGEALNSTTSAAGGDVWSRAASAEPVAEKSAAEEESSPSSDSSSDSDEETRSEEAIKTPVEFSKPDSVLSGADWTRERADGDRGRLVTEPKELSGAAKVPVSKDSTCTELSKGEGRETPAAQGSHDLLSSAVCDRAEATVTAPEASVPPRNTLTTQKTTASSPPREQVLSAQGESQEPQYNSAEERTPESIESVSADTLHESVGKPVEERDKEVLDTSTYKNTQHHDYNPLTFIDMDVDMAKYRLPQPSSGRITPRH